MKYWEAIADKLSKAGWSLGWVGWMVAAVAAAGYFVLDIIS